MKLVFATITAISVTTQVLSACPYAGKKLETPNFDDTLVFYDFPKDCSSFSMTVNGDPAIKNGPLKKKGKNWVFASDGVKVVFRGNGKTASIAFGGRSFGRTLTEVK